MNNAVRGTVDNAFSPESLEYGVSDFKLGAAGVTYDLWRVSTGARMPETEAGNCRLFYHDALATGMVLYVNASAVGVYFGLFHLEVTDMV